MTAFAFYVDPTIAAQVSALLWLMTWYGAQIVGVVLLARLFGRHNRKLFPAALVAGLVVVFGVSLSAQFPVPDPCNVAEPYSAAWWMAGCFMY